MIQDALLSRMKERPIQSITVKEICEAAGVGRSTFYAHYEDIYALLEDVEQRLLLGLGEALSRMEGPEAAGGERSLVAICTGIFQCLKDNADLCIVMLGDHSDKAFVQRLLEMGKEACLSAYSRYFQAASPDLIEAFYAFISAGCIGLLRWWAQSGMERPAKDIAQMAEGILLHGIGMLAGR